MDDRFICWLRACKKEGSLSNEEIKSVTDMDSCVCRDLFNDFTDYDSSAVTDFVFDSMITLLRESKLAESSTKGQNDHR